MESEGNIAQIDLEPKTRTVKHITLCVKNLRFKCKRCATFCCKLGGPTLSSRDVERLKKAGCKEVEFLKGDQLSLRNRADGSCVFLQLNKERDVYECSVYDSRPDLCRLYPFYFKKISPSLFVLKIMPCRGINRRVGEPVNEGFVANLLAWGPALSVSAKFY